MTPDEVKQSVTAWCSAADDLEVTGERSEPGADFALGVRAGGAGGAPVELLVLQGQGADRITLKHTGSLAGGSAADAQRILDGRPGWVSGSVDRDYTGTSVTVQAAVYHDGLSKNSFVQAASELARTSRLIGALATSAATSSAGAAATQAAATPQPSTIPQAQPMAAPSFSPQPQPQPQPQAQAAAYPQPAQAQASWVPTHSVPPQGMRAWAAPDPAGPVVANLAPGLPIQVTEVRGAWARVVCSNGWTGWIDGRIIGVAA